MGVVPRAAQPQRNKRLMRDEQSRGFHRGGTESTLIEVDEPRPGKLHKLMNCRRLPNEAELRILDRKITTMKENNKAGFARTVQKKVSQKHHSSILLVKFGEPHGVLSRSQRWRSSLRAEEKVLHGVPQCRKRIAPSCASCMMKSHFSASTTSNGVGTSEQGVMSIGGRQGMLAARAACVSAAVPEKISKNQGPAWATAAASRGTSSHESHKGGATVSGRSTTSYVSPVSFAGAGGRGGAWTSTARVEGPQ